MPDQYIPSTAPGKTWAVSILKHQGRPAVCSAVEGELSEADPVTGFRGFSFMLYGCRSRKVTLTGPANAKNKAAAREALLAQMRAAGEIL